MYQLSKRLKALKPAVRALSKDSYQGIHANVLEARRVLLEVQFNLLTTPSVPLMQQEKAQIILLNDLMVAEESILQQKSKIKWLQVGDKNTSFFLIRLWKVNNPETL